jgi:hypothetical protein
VWQGALGIKVGCVLAAEEALAGATNLDSVDGIHDGVFLLLQSDSLFVENIQRSMAGVTYGYSGEGACYHILEQAEVWR